VAAGLTLGVAAAQSGSAAPSPVLVVQRLVSEAAARAGSASLVRGAGRLEGLPDDPLAGALAEVFIQQAAGRADRALSAGLDALNRVSFDDGSDEIRGALIGRLISAGLDEAGRRMLLEGQHPVLQAGWALQLARDGRCDAAVTRASHLAERPPGALSARLMVASALQHCEAPVGGLGLLHATAFGRDEIDPRLAVALGELSLEAGDPDSARAWCARARSSARGLPELTARAGVCAAAADAARGVLPDARLDLIEAWVDALEAPAIATHVRREAALGAVWISVSAGDPESARRALELAERARQVPDVDRDGVLSALRAIAMVSLERARDARRMAAQARARAGGPEGEVLAAMAEARLMIRENDEVAASTRLGEAADEARRSVRQDLTAVVEMERARLSRWAGRDPAVRMHAVSALRSWREGAASPWRRPLVDPVLPRRAVEWSIAQGWSRSPTGRRAEALLEAAAEAQRALAPSPLGIEEVTDPGRVRRLLAARNASLLYYALGETRSFVWLIEPSGVRARELPAGGELARRGGLLASGEREALTGIEGLYGGLLETVRPGSSLMIRPDGVLYALAWRGLPTPTVWRAEAPTLGQAMTLAIVPDLDTAVDPRRTPIIDAEGRGNVYAVYAEGSARWPATATEPKPGNVSWHPVPLGASPDADRLGRVRNGQGVLLVSLPLLAAGRDGSGVLFGLPADPDRLPTPLALDELLSSRSRYQLLCLAPDPRWPVPAGARARAAAEATRLGVRTVVLPLQDIGERLRGGFWDRFLDAVARGRGEAAALHAAAPRTSDGRREHLPEFLLVGQANRVVASPGHTDWRFWVPLGAGVLVVIAVIARLLWPRRDPFDVEPPEE
jgi:hypothetical protein